MKFKIKHYAETDSTNTLALDALKKGAEEGLVITADFQNAGRGKPGNEWHSRPGENLLFSLLLKPPVPASKAPLVTQIACRSVAAVLKKAFSIDSTFKRPNDVLVQGKKICGILVESSSGASGKLHGLVIGMGLNVNSRERDLPENATSIKTWFKKDINRNALLEELLSQLERDLKELYAAPTA